MFQLLVDFVIDGKLPIDLIERKNQNDESCFFIACKNGSYEIVEYILSICKSSNKFSNYNPLSDRDAKNMTPLHVASRANHLQVLELLIENGADVNVEDKYEKLPIHYSCEIGSFEITKLLVEYKSLLNKLDE
jgi:ankyrin repeat protein